MKRMVRRTGREMRKGVRREVQLGFRLSFGLGERMIVMREGPVGQGQFFGMAMLPGCLERQYENS